MINFKFFWDLCYGYLLKIMSEFLSLYLSSGQAWLPENPSSEKLFITDSSANLSGLNLSKKTNK